MRAIIGLGNPGADYAQSRHNVGALYLDYLAEYYGCTYEAQRFPYTSPAETDYFVAIANVKDNPVLFIKPNRFVNNTGNILQRLLPQAHVKLDDIIVAYDDIYLPMGNIRLRIAGTDGGHNGIRSIIYSFRSEQFARFRFGIGGKIVQGVTVKDYVLSPFDAEEMVRMNEAFNYARGLMEVFVTEGTQKMLDYNSKTPRTELPGAPPPRNFPRKSRQEGEQKPSEENGAAESESAAEEPTE